MDFLGLGRARVLPRANRPHGLVCNGGAFRERVEKGSHLPLDDLERTPCRALLEALANACDGTEPCPHCRRHLLGHEGIGLAEVLTTLAMSDDHPSTARVDQHRAADLAREGSRNLRMEILRRDFHLASV